MVICIFSCGWAVSLSVAAVTRYYHQLRARRCQKRIIRLEGAQRRTAETVKGLEIQIEDMKI